MDTLVFFIILQTGNSYLVLVIAVLDVVKVDGGNGRKQVCKHHIYENRSWYQFHKLLNRVCIKL